MKIIYHIILALFILIKSAFSSSLYQELYSSPSLTQNNEVIIFYNSLQPCFNCSNLISKIINIIKNNYTPHNFSLYLIDLKYHKEFIFHFNLHPPLNLIALRIEDGSPSGFQKLPYSILNQEDTISLTTTITEFINNFFQIIP